MDQSLALINTQKPYNSDNLHLIAISNVRDKKGRLEKWWRKKYRIPSKQYEDHWTEELIILMLEDYYEENPTEADKMFSSAGSRFEEGDFEISEEYEDDMKKTYKKFFDRNKIDISKYQSNEEIDEKEEKAILDSIGRGLPGSRTKKAMIKNADEFDDLFGA